MGGKGGSGVEAGEDDRVEMEGERWPISPVAAAIQPAAVWMDAPAKPNN